MFKKHQKKFQQRRRQNSIDEDDNTEKDISTIVEDAKEIQKLRERQRGINYEDLIAINNKKDNQNEKDKYEYKRGGMVDMKSLKYSDKNEDLEAIGTSFAAETNRRDEDADMLKFVENELRKRKGEDNKDEQIVKQMRPEDALYALPEKIKNFMSSKKTEDMMSNQLLSGIPEVELGIEAKIKNIEATEQAKQKMMKDKRKKNANNVSEFVPTNMAVNFVQHNRFNIEDNTPILKQTHTDETKNNEKTVNSNKTNSNRKGPTDSYHYAKFVKHVKR